MDFRFLTIAAHYHRPRHSFQIVSHLLVGKPFLQRGLPQEIRGDVFLTKPTQDSLPPSLLDPSSAQPVQGLIQDAFHKVRFYRRPSGLLL